MIQYDMHVMVEDNRSVFRVDVWIAADDYSKCFRKFLKILEYSMSVSVGGYHGMSPLPSPSCISSGREVRYIVAC